MKVSDQLQHILTPLWACKAKKCNFSRKFDLWPDLTRSNVDLGLKQYVQLRDLVETHRLVFSAKLYDHQGPIARGVVPPPPPWPSALWEMPWPGEGSNSYLDVFGLIACQYWLDGGKYCIVLHIFKNVYRCPKACDAQKCVNNVYKWYLSRLRRCENILLHDVWIIIFL